jgi:hypothetical protein
VPRWWLVTVQAATVSQRTTTWPRSADTGHGWRAAIVAGGGGCRWWLVPRLADAYGRLASRAGLVTATEVPCRRIRTLTSGIASPWNT